MKKDKYSEMKKKIPNIKNIMRIRQSRKKGDMGYLSFFMLGLDLWLELAGQFLLIAG